MIPSNNPNFHTQPTHQFMMNMNHYSSLYPKNNIPFNNLPQLNHINKMRDNFKQFNNNSFPNHFDGMMPGITNYVTRPLMTGNIYTPDILPINQSYLYSDISCCTQNASVITKPMWEGRMGNRFNERKHRHRRRYRSNFKNMIPDNSYLDGEMIDCESDNNNNVYQYHIPYEKLYCTSNRIRRKKKYDLESIIPMTHQRSMEKQLQKKNKREKNHQRLRRHDIEDMREHFDTEISSSHERLITDEQSTNLTSSEKKSEDTSHNIERNIEHGSNIMLMNDDKSESPRYSENSSLEDEDEIEDSNEVQLANNIQNCLDEMKESTSECETESTIKIESTSIATTTTITMTTPVLNNSDEKDNKCHLFLAGEQFDNKNSINTTDDKVQSLGSVPESDDNREGFVGSIINNMIMVSRQNDNYLQDTPKPSTPTTEKDNVFEDISFLSGMPSNLPKTLSSVTENFMTESQMMKPILPERIPIFNNDVTSFEHDSMIDNTTSNNNNNNNTNSSQCIHIPPITNEISFQDSFSNTSPSNDFNNQWLSNEGIAPTNNSTFTKSINFLSSSQQIESNNDYNSAPQNYEEFSSMNLFNNSTDMDDSNQMNLMDKTFLKNCNTLSLSSNNYNGFENNTHKNHSQSVDSLERYLKRHNNSTNILEANTQSQTLDRSRRLINYDPNPKIIKKICKQPIIYKQKIGIRYLQPSTPPPPGPIIIREVIDAPTKEIPPIIIQQIPEKQRTPSPLILREMPPPPPVQVKPTVITKVISGPPQPQYRKVIIERLPPLPPKPPSIIIERWLPYPKQKRQVIYQKAPPLNEDNSKENFFNNSFQNPTTNLNKNNKKPNNHNIIIQWDAPNIQIERKVKYLGIQLVKDMKKFYEKMLNEKQSLNSQQNIDMEKLKDIFEEMKNKNFLETTNNHMSEGIFPSTVNMNNMKQQISRDHINFSLSDFEKTNNNPSSNSTYRINNNNNNNTNSINNNNTNNDATTNTDFAIAQDVSNDSQSDPFDPLSDIETGHQLELKQERNNPNGHVEEVEKIGNETERTEIVELLTLINEFNDKNEIESMEET
ncbi:hypothetical protein SNEBB_006129 [Seison nebaliae]|nr:hypothetical protein SNEBB_006129 [Seison nebaliae]